MLLHGLSEALHCSVNRNTDEVEMFRLSDNRQRHNQINNGKKQSFHNSYDSILRVRNYTNFLDNSPLKDKKISHFF